MKHSATHLCWLASLLLAMLLLAGCAPATQAIAGSTSTALPAPTSAQALAQPSPALTPTPPPAPSATQAPTPPPGPSPEPTVDARPLSQVWDGFKFDLTANPQDAHRTDVTVSRPDTGQEVYHITLDDLYVEHYHGLEFHGGNLYAIRRIGYDGYPDEDWTDELWRYDTGQQGARLYQQPGLDFRAAPDGRTIAVCCLGSDLLTFLDATGNVLHQFGIAELSVPWQSPLGPPGIMPDQWSADSRAFWGQAAAAADTNAFFRIAPASWQAAAYPVAGLHMGRDYALNPGTGLLAYSDYPQIFDADSAESFKESGKPVTLYVYDLAAQSTQTVAVSAAKAFHPTWLDAATIEFDDPAGEARITHTLQ